MQTTLCQQPAHDPGRQAPPSTLGVGSVCSDRVVVVLVEEHAFNSPKRLSKSIKSLLITLGYRRSTAACVVVVDDRAILRHSAGELVSRAPILHFCEAAAGDEDRPVAVLEQRSQCQGTGTGERREPKRLGLEHTVQIEAMLATSTASACSRRRWFKRRARAFQVCSASP